MNAAAGVTVVIAAIVLVRAVWKRANPGARLAAIGGVSLAIWLLIGMASPADAGKLAAWLLGGVAAVVTGAAHLIGQI